MTRLVATPVKARGKCHPRRFLLLRLHSRSYDMASAGSYYSRSRFTFMLRRLSFSVNPPPLTHYCRTR